MSVPNMTEADLHKALQLTNPRRVPEARIGMISLPVPLSSPRLTGLSDLPTQVQPIGWWPESVAGRAGAVRRQLMSAISDGPLPEEIPVTTEGGCSGPYRGPEMSCRILEKKNVGIVLEEVNEAAFAFGKVTFGVRMGLRHAGEIKWWQWVRSEELWSGPLCKAVRAGGFIEVEHFGDEYLERCKNVMRSRSAHFHNWLRGEVFALMFANGVLHLTCRHVNNHLFDHGRDLEDVVPVIGFTTPGLPDLDETLDGARTRFDLGGVSLNLDEAAAFVGPEHPGALRREKPVLIYQPYEGVEIFGDTHKRVREDGYIVRAAEKKMPKGVARTVRFGVGLGADAPVISRFVAPEWWYGASRDLWPSGALPVHDDADAVVEHHERHVAKAAANRPRCFDNAVLTRSNWEGETPYAQMLYYYRSGSLDHLDIALTDAYHMADIGFDHATETIRMHDFPFGAIAPPLYRTVGMTFGYLETGDPYLLECSESAATRFYWIDRHNWPRRSYGRDAASIRSLIFLWDYTGKEDYMTMAREALGRTIACQRPDGSYADQGGAVGAGGAANEIIKVWMSALADDPIVDYLERRPEDRALSDALVRSGEFLLDAQIEKDGKYYWAYQEAYGDNPVNPRQAESDPPKRSAYPSGKRVAGYKARILTFLTSRTGDPRYLAAWEKFYDTHWALGEKMPGGHTKMATKTVQGVLYAQAHRWNARIEKGCVRIRPLLTEWAPRINGEIATPFGRLKVACAKTDAGVEIKTECPAAFDVLVDLPGRAGPERMSSNDCATFS